MSDFLGQRIWYNDGKVYTCPPRKWENLPEDGILIRMLYYKGGAKQSQQNDWYFEAPHHSGEPIRGTCSDARLKETKERYPEAVFKRGQWGPDDYYRKIVDEAMSSAWKDGG